MEETKEVKTSVKEDAASDIEVIFGKPEHSEVLADFSAKMAFETEDKTIDTKPIAQAFQRFLSFEPSKEGERALGFYLVAVTSSGVCVGSMMITYECNPVIGGLIYMIHNVYVEKEYRKLGVFKKIYNKAKQLAEEDPNCKCMRLFVELENELAMKVYTRMGMARIDNTVMEKDIKLG
ncbi:unnamed protein product [Moneuplotes crassus]|uniref:N-acetyltransferase domain-containing protein n=1 Tax=Euplotes crassus TaxID=5936 RepID=A0AAD1XZX7_EUPCR|nr:unnamed protein product [Moneuplotes crassus]